MIAAVADRESASVVAKSRNEKGDFLQASAPVLPVASGARPTIVSRVSVAAGIKIVGRVLKLAGKCVSYEAAGFEIVFRKPAAELTSLRLCVIVCHQNMLPMDVRNVLDDVIKWRVHFYTLICSGACGPAADQASMFKSGFHDLGLAMSVLAGRDRSSVRGAPEASGPGTAAAAAVSTELPKTRAGPFWEVEGLISVRMGKSSRSDEKAVERDARRWERKDASQKRKETEQ